MAVQFDPNAINSIENTSRTKQTTDAKSAKAGGSWMMALAETLGKLADKMGQEVADTAKLIDKATDEKFNEGKMNEGQSGSHGISELNATMQVQTQLLSMFMGAISNIIKTIGEGNSGLARKQ